MRRPGEHVVLRQLFRGRVWSATTGNVVVDSPELVAVWLPPGAPGLRPEGGLFDGWTLRRHVFSRAGGILRVTEAGRGYSVLLFGVVAPFEGWYVNLEEPLLRRADGWEFEDHLLDVWIDPDRSWRWVDEDELEEAVARGLVGRDAEAEIRAAGDEARERVVAGAFDEWLRWRPDPAWTLPPRELVFPVFGDG